VAAQDSQLAQVNATLPPLIKQAAQLRDLLAVLAGQFPSNATNEKFELSSLQLPEEVPVSLPSALVAQRPDVLQAEANLHDASARIGIAIANRLPQFLVTGSYGTQATGTIGLFRSSTETYLLQGGISIPLFTGGRLVNEQRAWHVGGACLRGCEPDSSAAQFSPPSKCCRHVDGVATGRRRLEGRRKCRSGCAGDPGSVSTAPQSGYVRQLTGAKR
jgi:hypothetical protein